MGPLLRTTLVLVIGGPIMGIAPLMADDAGLNSRITCGMAAFLADLKRDPEALQSIRERLRAGRVEEAAEAYAAWFRARSIDTSLLRDWEQVPRQADYRTSRQDGLLAGAFYDGYSVYELPEEGLDWHRAPLTCLTRFPIFPALQLALHHTQDPKYLRFMIEHLNDYMTAYPMEQFLPYDKGGYGWIDDRTVARPWHWSMYCNRIQRLAEVLEQIRHYDAVTDRELARLLHRFYRETAYLRREMKRWVDRRHNGGGAMINAMTMACEILRDFQVSEDWRRFNVGLLNQYIRESFYADGCCIELTCAYSSSVARNVQNMVWALGDEAGFAVEPDRLKAIQVWLAAMAKPTGRIPSFGDLYVGHSWERYLHVPLARRLGQDRLAAFAEGDAPDPGLRRVWPAPGDEQWCGYYVMRSGWDPAARYLAVDGGPWGTTHAHGDKLSFVLSAYGADFVVDPGSTKYRNNEPDAFISTQKPGFLHNTITIDGVDEFLHGPRESGEPLQNVWRHGERWHLFASSYDFSPLRPVRWERRFLFVNGDYWLLQDVLTSSELETVTVEQNMQMNAEIEVQIEGATAICSAANGARLLVNPLGSQLQPVVSRGDRTPRTTYWPAGKPRTEDWFPSTEDNAHGRGWNGRGGNALIPAPAVTWQGDVSLPAVISVLLVPAEAGREFPDIDARVVTDGVEFECMLPDGDGGWIIVRGGPQEARVIEASQEPQKE